MTIASPLAMITGASSGLGSVYADRLAARGYDLLLVARRIGRLHDLAETMRKTYGVAVETLKADLATEAGLAAVERLIATNDRIAMLVNNAGNGTFVRFAEMSAEAAASTIMLNMIAPTRLIQAVLPGMLARDSGVIVNISSVMALNASAVSSLYSATKSYLLTLSQGLQAEVAGTRVRVQVVLPARTATEFANGGVERTEYDPALVMTKEQLVDAALAGLDLGEAVTIPPLQEIQSWENYEDARSGLFGATQHGEAAPRYLIDA